jgi:ribosomal protein S18 acetylase RimI-like enzyme
MPEPTIRPATPDDVENLAALARDIWHRHYPGIISREQIDYMLAQRYAPPLIQAQLGRPDQGWWVAERGSRLAGFAHAWLADGYCKLDKLYVHPDHQRHGLGAALLDAARSWATSQGRNRLVLQVNRHNTLALGAYRKYGFSIVESRVCDIGDGYVMDDYFMELKLG